MHKPGFTSLAVMKALGRPRCTFMAAARCVCARSLGSAADADQKLCIELRCSYRHELGRRLVLPENCTAEGPQRSTEEKSMQVRRFLAQRPDFTVANWAAHVIHIYVLSISPGCFFQIVLKAPDSLFVGFLFVSVAVCAALYKLWISAWTNNGLVINHCWFDVKSFGNGEWYWLK